ncbi:MAG: sulfurtransferase, partial [Alicyclobacillus sp.]|nr:sulfurtransferase [Alicyclobacillus sp.]
MLWSVERLLEAKLAGIQLVLFDCRFSLADPNKGRSQYLAGHIPGAYYLDLEQDLSGPKAKHGGRHPLPDPQELANKLGTAGVHAGVQVVVYDAGEGMAPRAWWLIRYLGHDQVAVLDGGLPAWERAGQPLTDDVPEPNPAIFPLAVRHDWVVDVRDVEAIVAGDAPGVLIDARARERYRGDVEPLDPKAGHIPGAVNAPWQENIDAAGHWHPAVMLRQKFNRLIQPGQPIVAYCGSG